MLAGKCIRMNCTNLNCDCGYIIKNESLKYNEDKLAGCLSQHLFFKIIESCFDYSWSTLSIYSRYSFSASNVLSILSRHSRDLYFESDVEIFVRYFY